MILDPQIFFPVTTHGHMYQWYLFGIINVIIMLYKFGQTLDVFDSPRKL
jgi:hypothetical protein